MQDVVRVVVGQVVVICVGEVRDVSNARYNKCCGEARCSKTFGVGEARCSKVIHHVRTVSKTYLKSEK